MQNTFCFFCGICAFACRSYFCLIKTHVQEVFRPVFVPMEWAIFAVAVNGSMLLSIKEKLLISNYYPNITFDAQKILNNAAQH